MKTRDALATYFERRKIKPKEESVDQWLDENWAYMSILGRRVPVKPLYVYKPIVVIHDVHHLLTGYDTTWTGEFEVAAWEVGSGGCDRYLLMWINRFFTLLLGAVFAPRATWRALRRGAIEHNLYRFDCRSILSCDVDELTTYRTTGAWPRDLLLAPTS
jgi:hypothetical protein